jgi:hypothetical protein
MKVAICACETDEVPKRWHTGGSAPLLESENTLNTREGSKDHTHAPQLPETEMRAQSPDTVGQPPAQF